MKKQILAFFAFSMALTSWAEEVPVLKITTSEAETNMELKDISRVKYTETEMIVYLANGTQQTFVMDDITSMTFDNADNANALRSVLGTGKDSKTTFDLNGRQVRSVKKGGLYIIKMGKETKKVKK